MNISSNGNRVTIEGNIKSVSDFQMIKSTVDNVNGSDIYLIIKDSFSITSSVIGYLNKLIHKDGVTIHMSVNDARLYDLLNDLNLISLFNVTKV